ncbi:FtsK/SpoIIIE domain-containing protein [Allorhizocola rhizosphaerae]|uniref:FtsK/SpoIIIE domain-containing protein n=1 Tax=Allorhizocola rhizosphaerae TaxID=1872709 RepID=UPI0013C30CBE|nr:FtsK/SpoIIIE domain-containing protein [Allorhizocola rhizosphaerae]
MTMDLLLTAVDTTAAEYDLMLTADPESTGHEVIVAIHHVVPAAARGQRVFVERTRAELLPDRPIGDAGLRLGDRLLLTGPVAPPWLAPGPTGAKPAFEVLIVGGPQAGRRLPLAAGSALYAGRDPGCQLTLDDSQVSRRHLHIGAGSRQVSLTDLGSSNGTFVDGVKISGTVDVRPGQVIALGNTLLTVEKARTSGGSGTAVSYADGRLAFARPPRIQRPTPATAFKLPAPPPVPPPRRIPLMASLLPVVLGGVMAVLLGPIMLLFALMGPVMLAGSVWEDKRSGRRDHKLARQKFASEMDSLSERIAAAHAELLAARRAAAPNPAQLAERVTGHRPELWERRSTDRDFATVRIGTSDLPSHLRLDGDPKELATTEAERVEAVMKAYATDPDVPVDVDLRAIGVLGVAGTGPERDALLRWLVMQHAVLASPRELAIVVLAPPGSGDAWAWTRWLPHTETLLAGVPGARTVAYDGEDARAVLQIVDDLMQQRRIALERGTGHDGFWYPNILVLIPGDLPVPRSALSRVLADGPSLGIMAVTGAATPETLPGECRAVVKTGGGKETTVTLTSNGDTVPGIVVDGVSLPLATDVARQLAPMRDSSAQTAGGEVPRRALLLDLLELPSPDAAGVARRWEALGSNGLGAPIGVGPSGPITIDLRRDGPHGLTAGTTGAGKSELLQSMIGALAATYPASRLTFVLVDYKGGAAFKDCVGLPHTVGFFTDLDAHLAKRALVSLNAELRRREEILREHAVKDLIELERRHPAHAPANLFIVIDEFAFLKKELPEFVAGVIDIAQRGRSLGVHLMLATQRPAGVIDDNIRANTNLRIALRVADEGDSNDVLDRPDAARIPKSLPGRGHVRVGHGEISLVQSAYANARSSQGPQRIAASARLAPAGSGLRSHSGGGTSSGDDGHDDRPTDLQRLVSAIRDAHVARGVPEQPRPWLDSLGGCYALDSLAGGDDPFAVPLGLADLPARQTQQPWLLDVTERGHLLVYGTAGAGKTQALRTLAAGLANRLDPADVHLYGLDFASGGLRSLEALPHCGGVAGADEPERVDRLFTMLGRVIAERKQLLGAGGFSSIREYRRKARLPYMVVLLDGYGAFHQTYINVDRGELVDTLARQVADGRAAGVLFAVTADRRNAIPSTLSGAISTRLVLRMADADEYASLGLPMAIAQAEIPPGRGFIDGDEVQIAVLGSDASGAAQAAAVASLAIACGRDGPLPTPVTVLPAQVSLAELDASPAGPLTVALGLSGIDQAASFVDLGDTPVFAVFGPDRSGRSTALATLCAGIRGQIPDIEAYLLAPRRSVLVDSPHWTEAALTVDACDALAQQLNALLRERTGDRPWLVVIDDGDELADLGSLANLVRRGRDARMILLAAVQTHVAHRAFGGWITDLRKSKHGMLLRPEIDLDGELFGQRLPLKASRRFPPGRAYVMRRGDIDYVQVAQITSGPA